MKKTFSVSISRRNNEEKRNKNDSTNTEVVLNKPEDFDNIVVMKGTAKRKLLENRSVRIVQEKTFRESFLKLRAPFYKPYQKQAATEEKFMTKSCEVLFECIKPYKDIRIRKFTKSIQLKTIDTIFERSAVRRVEFLSFCEETPEKNFVEDSTLDLSETGNGVVVKTESKQKEKTFSSEDFITDVLI